MRTLISNVTIVDAEGIRVGKVMIEDDKIKKVYKENDRVQATHDVEIDGRGKVLIPGFIDMHSHLRDPGLTQKEDFNTGLAAAVKGGFTTVVAMANTRPVMDNAALMAETLERAAAVGLSDVIQVAAVTEGFGTEKTVNFKALRELTPIFSNDGYNVDDGAIMKKALNASKKYDFILATHCEPETETVQRDIELLRATSGSHLHVCHISKKATLDAIMAAKAEGLDITCEVTPHHLYASALEYRVHPPFRSWGDRRALIEGAMNVEIDCCGTDHAPHTDADKIAGAPGINNFETAFAMYHTVFKGAGIPITRLSEMMSAAPAARLGLKAGLVKDKYTADLVLVDLEDSWKVDPKAFVSKSHNTPFVGERLTGRVLLTFKGGKIVYDHGPII
ncbi:dihydroorotase [Eubacterium aggregans]|uniref:dihydroorotase n=1 Tax=Eubacterium aggregans TaxID=81409 RepID=UPI003F30BC7E